MPLIFIGSLFSFYVLLNTATSTDFFQKTIGVSLGSRIVLVSLLFISACAYLQLPRMRSIFLVTMAIGFAGAIAALYFFDVQKAQLDQLYSELPIDEFFARHDSIVENQISSFSILEMIIVIGIVGLASPLVSSLSKAPTTVGVVFCVAFISSVVLEIIGSRFFTEEVSKHWLSSLAGIFSFIAVMILGNLALRKLGYRLTQG